MLLEKECRRKATLHITTHEKKLLNLWKKQAERCTDCIANYSKKRLTAQERNVLRFELNNPILPKKVQKEKIKQA